MRLAAAALVLASGCTLHQAARTRQVSEIVAGSALITLIAACGVEATVPDAASEAKVVALATIPVTLISTGVYIAADQRLQSPDPSPSEPIVQRSEENNRLARKLARDAAIAARGGDCPEVRTLELRVKELDLNVHVAMLRNAKIVECLRETEL